MAQNITLLGASYMGVPAVELPKTGGGTATFTDVSDTTATASTILSGYSAYNASGTLVSGSVDFVTYYTGSLVPSSSLGSDGDIYLRTS